MYPCYSVNMSETKQISVPATPKHALRFGIWCKMNGMTQAEGFAKLVEEHVPDFRISIKQK